MPAPETSLDLIRALRGYSNHHPTCPGLETLGTCSCGFSEVLARSGAIMETLKAEAEAIDRIQDDMNAIEAWAKKWTRIYKTTFSNKAEVVAIDQPRKPTPPPMRRLRDGEMPPGRPHHPNKTAPSGSESAGGCEEDE